LQTAKLEELRLAPIAQLTFMPAITVNSMISLHIMSAESLKLREYWKKRNPTFVTTSPFKVEREHRKAQAPVKQNS